MKRKSRRFQAPVSGQKKVGFSLNGGLRNQGWVGQGVRGRTLVGTPFRGVTARGSGGCCGTYSKNIVNNKLQVNPGDTKYIKRSTMNTPGHIAATVIYPTSVLVADCSGGTCPTIWVQKYDPLDHAQSNYINDKGIQAICVVDVSNAGIKRCLPDCKARSYHIGGKKFYATLYAKNTSAVSSSEYTHANHKLKQCLPPPPCKAPFPIFESHTGWCDINYTTPQDAINAGVLPADWMNCAPGTIPGTI